MPAAKFVPGSLILRLFHGGPAAATKWVPWNVACCVPLPASLHLSALHATSPPVREPYAVVPAWSEGRRHYTRACNSVWQRPAAACGCELRYAASARAAQRTSAVRISSNRIWSRGSFLWFQVWLSLPTGEFLRGQHRPWRIFSSAATCRPLPQQRCRGYPRTTAQPWLPPLWQLPLRTSCCEAAVCCGCKNRHPCFCTPTLQSRCFRQS